MACAVIRRCSIKIASLLKEYLDIIVNRVTTEEYGASIAKRPFNSRLDKSKLIDNGFMFLPDWKDALRRYLKEAKRQIDKKEPY